jgi:hypothetical protein
MNWRKRSITGSTVAVHPDYKGTGAERKGETAKIKEFYPEKSMVTVMFRDRHKAVYYASSLLCLRKQKEILCALRRGLFKHSADCLLMLLVYRFVFLGRQAKALKLAMTNNITLYYCTISCQQRIEQLNKSEREIH